MVHATCGEHTTAVLTATTAARSCRAAICGWSPAPASTTRRCSSRDALKRTLIEYHAGFPDLFHTIDDVIGDADRIVVRTTTIGTHHGPFLGHPPTRRRFKAAAISVYRIEDRVIQEVWEIFDTIAMLQQLGLYSAAPGPAPNPAVGGVGHPPPGPAVEVSLAQIRSDPLTFLQRLTREYGDYVLYVCDGRATILLNQPQAIRHVLHERAENYTKLDTPDLLLLKPMLGEGLLTTVGPIWKRDRQQLQPVFARLTEGAAEPMVQVIEEMLARWRARPNSEAPLDIAQEMSRLTLEIAARVLLSTDFASQSEAFGNAMTGTQRVDEPQPTRGPRGSARIPAGAGVHPSSGSANHTLAEIPR